MFKDYIEVSLVFTPSIVDPDFYHQNNELLLVYVDDVLEISHNPKVIMEKTGIIFEIKNDEYGPPTHYIGADVGKFQLAGSKEVWILTSNYDVRMAVDTVKSLLDEDGR